MVGITIGFVDAALILAHRIILLIREAGVNKIEAYAALNVAEAILPTIEDISLKADEQEAPAAR